MSNLENDKIWDQLIDAHQEGELDFEEFMSMDLEDAFEYLMNKGD